MIEFVTSDSKNYEGVQQQLLGTIKRHLAPDSYFDTERSKYEKKEGVLSFDLFNNGPADVLMSHGAADKNYMLRRDPDTAERIINRRKHVFVPGPWLRDRLIASKSITLSPEQIHCVGWPRLDDLLAGYNPQPLQNRRLRVLWAPSHDYARKGEEQLSLSSYPEFEQYLPRLKKYADVSVSLHPRNRKEKAPTTDNLLAADFVISDFGTMVYEAWALGKPVIFPSWIIGERILTHQKRSAEAHIFNERIGLHASSFDDVIRMIAEPPVLDSRTKAFLDSYLSPEYLGSSGKRCAELLMTLPG
ncbi:MAG: hypothetical protein JWP59_4423 [Massilia sp.]|nr:hypothetical protein [Massilia sp.]